jgi:hypothetical protein
MRLLHLLCKACGCSFESGVPLQREHLEGAKVRTLEVCPVCGTAADYQNEDYFETGGYDGADLDAGRRPGDTPERPQ